MRDFIRAAGGECEVVDWHGQPLAIGELRASTGAESAPTVLCYGHFDVQPPDPLELWECDPFEPEIRDDYLYGRGTVDDKGQLYMLLSAARELARAGELPVNVRFCCDGEEETGGHSIVEFLEADERGADAAIIFDSGMIRRDVPAFNVATRGMAYFHVTLRTGERDLHSGDLRRRRAERRARADQDARRAGRARRHARRLAAQGDRAAPTDEELAAGRSCRPAPTSSPSRARGRRTPRAAEDFYLRTFAEPALDVNGIADRLAAPAEDGAAGRGGRERVDPARAGTDGRGDRARGRAAAARGGPGRRGARDRAAGRRRRPGSSRPTRRRSSSASTRSSGRSAAGRR